MTTEDQKDTLVITLPYLKLIAELTDDLAEERDENNALRYALARVRADLQEAKDKLANR